MFKVTKILKWDNVKNPPQNEVDYVKMYQFWIMGGALIKIMPLVVCFTAGYEWTL